MRNTYNRMTLLDTIILTLLISYLSQLRPLSGSVGNRLEWEERGEAIVMEFVNECARLTMYEA